MADKAEDPDPVGGTDRPFGSPAANRALMDEIADVFDASRAHAWRPVVDWLAGLPPGARILDLASGNGRHALAGAELGHEVVAVDVARVLARKVRARARAQARGSEGAPLGGTVAVSPVEADAVHLPVRDEVFDHAICVAGIHSIEGRQSRRAALAEMCRVVRRGGSALVTVWRREQARSRAAIPGAEPGDVSVPWRHGRAVPAPRFFHLYALGELAEDLEAAGWVHGAIEAVALGGPRANNWWVELTRP